MPSASCPQQKDRRWHCWVLGITHIAERQGVCVSVCECVGAECGKARSSCWEVSQIPWPTRFILNCRWLKLTLPGWACSCSLRGVYRQQSAGPGAMCPCQILDGTGNRWLRAAPCVWLVLTPLTWLWYQWLLIKPTPLPLCWSCLDRRSLGKVYSPFFSIWSCLEPTGWQQEDFDRGATSSFAKQLLWGGTKPLPYLQRGAEVNKSMRVPSLISQQLRKGI